MIYFYVVDPLLLPRVNEVNQGVGTGTTSGLAGDYLRVIGVTLTHTSAQSDSMAKSRR
jgi:hypothetical protein